MTPSRASEPISPRTSERRSPKALAHDPPVTRLDWITDADLSADAFLADARGRGEWDDAQWERLLHHGGLHLDRRRWERESPPARVPAGTSVVAYSFERDPAPLMLSEDAILLDEGGLVAVNKPPWWAAQGTRASRVVSLERELRRRLSCPALTPVHRLDRETSGVMLFARDARLAGELGRQFAKRSVRKEYLALVSPAAREPAWTIEGLIVRIEHPSHSLFTLVESPADMASHPGQDGQPSRTRFELVATAASGERSLVRAHPLTGRTHQLRVHLVASGCPIVGDSLYGGGWSPGAAWSADRLQLHAAAISLKLAGVERRIEAPLPDDFEWGGPTHAAGT